MTLLLYRRQLRTDGLGTALPLRFGTNWKWQGACAFLLLPAAEHRENVNQRGILPMEKSNQGNLP